MLVGWIKLHRRFAEWEWYKDSKMVHLFIHLLLKANHNNNTWKGINIERGQLITSYDTLERQTKISTRSLRTCIKKLKMTGEITNKTTNRYSIITICNYDEYQNILSEIDKQSDKQTVGQATSKQEKSDKQSDNKQEEKNNKEEIRRKEYIQFLEIFNSITGRNFRGTDKDKRQFNARIKEGYTIDHFKTAITNCKNDPYHVENQRYLTPEFITRQDKLEKYLHWIPPKEKDERFDKYTNIIEGIGNEPNTPLL